MWFEHQSQHGDDGQEDHCDHDNHQVEHRHDVGHGHHQTGDCDDHEVEHRHDRGNRDHQTSDRNDQTSNGNDQTSGHDHDVEGHHDHGEALSTETLEADAAGPVPPACRARRWDGRPLPPFTRAKAPDSGAFARTESACAGRRWAISGSATV